MSNFGEGYTSFFNSIAAGEVNVAGLARGSAGALGVPAPGRSSYPAQFAISADTQALMRPARRFLHAYPATQSNAFVPELLAAD